MAYDSKCYDLAEAFLEDEPHLNTEGRRDELAQLIQTTIEDFIAHEQSNYEPPDGWQPGGPDLHQMQIDAMKLK